MSDEPDEYEDPLARPPVVLERTEGRTASETIRMILAQEGIPATVERVPGRGHDRWSVLVSADAAEDAARTLENRASLAAGIDWDEFDVGELSARDARLLARAPRRRLLARLFVSIGSILLLGMILLGLVAMIADLIPSEG